MKKKIILYELLKFDAYTKNLNVHKNKTVLNLIQLVYVHVIKIYTILVQF